MKNRMNICNVDLRHVQTTKTTTNQTKTIQTIWVIVVYTNQHAHVTGLITLVRINEIMLLYVVCTEGSFVCNTGGVVQLLVTYITMCDLYLMLCLNM